MAFTITGTITPYITFRPTGIITSVVTQGGVGPWDYTFSWTVNIGPTGTITNTFLNNPSPSLANGIGLPMGPIPPDYTGNLLPNSGVAVRCTVSVTDSSVPTPQTVSGTWYMCQGQFIPYPIDLFKDGSDGMYIRPTLTTFWADFKIFKRDALYGEEHRTADFKAKGSNGTLPYRFQWNFGDEATLDDQVWLPSTPSNTAFKYTHLFPDFGPYTVTLRAWDADFWDPLGNNTGRARGPVGPDPTIPGPITLTDTTKTWGVGLWEDYYVLLADGPRAGHSFKITNSTVNSITFNYPFSNNYPWLGSDPSKYVEYRITWPPVEVQHDWMVEDLPSPLNCYWTEEHAGFDGTTWHTDSGGFLQDPGEDSEYSYFSKGITAVRYFNRYLYISGILDKSGTGSHDGSAFLAKVKIDTGEVVWQKTIDQSSLSPAYNPPPDGLVNLAAPDRYGWDVAPPYIGSIERLNDKIYLATVTQERSTYGSVTAWYNRPCILILDQVTGEIDSSITINLNSGAYPTGSPGTFMYPTIENDYGRYLIDIPYLYKVPEKEEFLLLGDFAANDYIRRGPAATYRKSWDTHYSAYVTTLDSSGKSKGLSRTIVFNRRRLGAAAEAWGELGMARTTNETRNVGTPARFRVLKIPDSFEGKAIVAWLESKGDATGAATDVYYQTGVTALRFDPTNLSITGPYIKISNGVAGDLFLKNVFTNRSTSTNSIVALGYYKPTAAVVPSRTVLIRIDLSGTTPTYKVWAIGTAAPDPSPDWQGKLIGGIVVENDDGDDDVIVYGYSSQTKNPGGYTIGFFMSRITHSQLIGAVSTPIQVRRFTSDYQTLLNDSDPTAEFELTDTGFCMVTTAKDGVHRRLFIAHLRKSLETGGDCGIGFDPVFETDPLSMQLLNTIPANTYSEVSGSSYTTNYYPSAISYTPSLGQSEGTPVVTLEDVERETTLICDNDCEAPTGLRSARFDLYGISGPE